MASIASTDSALRRSTWRPRRTTSPGNAFEVAEAALGDPAGLCASDSIFGAQAAVQISNPNAGTYPPTPFYVELYD